MLKEFQSLTNELTAQQLHHKLVCTQQGQPTMLTLSNGGPKAARALVT